MQAAAVDIDGPASLALVLVKLPLHQHTVHDLHALLQGEAYDEEEDSCVLANDPANDQQHQIAEDEDGHHHDDSTNDQCMQCSGAHLPAVQAQESACEWQQAYDNAYGCFYYYRERTQVAPDHAM